MDWTAVVTAMIGAVTGITVAALGLSEAARKTGAVTQDLIEYKRNITFTTWLANQTKADIAIAQLIETTCFKRVLIFRATNGRMNPNVTSCVRQWRADGLLMKDYIEFPLDDDHRAILKKAEKEGPTLVATSELSDAAVLKGVYRSENITWSEIIFLCEEQYSDGRRAIAYMSVASIEERPPSFVERAELARVAAIVKEAASHFV